MSAEPTISAVVATHGRRQALPLFLDALLPDPELLEVIVVVDGSPDDSAAYVRQRAETDGRLRCIEVDHLGQFGALERGIAEASGDVVLLLDDDVVAQVPLAARHRAHHVDADDLVVLGYMPVADTSGPDEVTKTIYADSYEDRCRWFDEHPDQVLEHLWGGNVSLRRDAALRVGLEPGVTLPEGFDARFYQQDRAFGLRCAGGGLRGRFDRDLLAHHQYTRPLVAHRRDIRGRAVSGQLLHGLFPAELGPFDADALVASDPISWLFVRIGRTPAYGVFAAGLSVAANIAGRLGLRAVERNIVRSFNPLETGRGLCLAEALPAPTVEQL